MSDLDLQVKQSLKRVSHQFSDAALKNAQLNDQEKTAFKTKLESTPIRMRIELTNECNLRCTFCYKSYFNNKDKLQMSLDVFKKLDPYMKRAKFLTFFTKSEPLIAENLKPALEMTADYGAVRYFSTNGIPLTREKSEWLVDNRLTFLQVSVNSFTPKEYAKVYRGGQLEVLENNLKTLNDVKKERKSIFPKVRISMCGTKESIVNIEDGIRFAKKYQLEEGVQITPFYELGEEHDGQTYEDSPEFFRSYYERGKRLANELGVPFWIISDATNPDGELKYCYDPWESMSIEPNGEVFPCVVSNQSMGNVNKQSLDEIWNGPKIQEFRSKVNITTDDQNEECKNCLNCHVHKLKTATNTARPLKTFAGGYYRVKN